ncbi:MAG: hypothetical protein HYT93_00710 [Parcubacteria group bacterium]|nr:hypothetical protein [Parcubacteria group bacterium]
MATTKYPPISPGTLVKTTQPNLNLRHQWTDEGWASKKSWVQGKVITHHDSHGLCYDVEHEDGTVGCYDPSEIEAVRETPDLAREERRREAEMVLHHDDSPCTARLNKNGYCPECKFVPDMQSTCFYYYCPACNIPLPSKSMTCTQCNHTFAKPGK